MDLYASKVSEGFYGLVAACRRYERALVRIAQLPNNKEEARALIDTICTSALWDEPPPPLQRFEKGYNMDKVKEMSQLCKCKHSNYIHGIRHDDTKPCLTGGCACKNFELEEVK